MGAIYQGQCGECGYRTGEYLDKSPAIIIDKGEEAPRGYFTHPDSPQIVNLSDPPTYSPDFLCRMQWQGRALEIYDWFCGNCGHPYESRRLGYPTLAFGCKAPIILSAIAIPIVFVVMDSILLALLLAVVMPLNIMLLLDLVARLMLTLKPGKIASGFTTPVKCPRCARRRPKTSGTVPCPKCRNKSMKIEVTAIS